ncbi:MAG: NTP transferase domain-containing protein, partial [Methanosarcinales archaeon]
MAYYEEIAAVVLAGGSGSRAGYVEKALLEFDGVPLLTHII